MAPQFTEDVGIHGSEHPEPADVYTSGPSGQGPYGIEGNAVDRPPTAAGNMSGLCGDRGANVTSSGLFTADQGPLHPVPSAPGPGGQGMYTGGPNSGVVKKLGQIARMIFGKD